MGSGIPRGLPLILRFSLDRCQDYHHHAMENPHPRHPANPVGLLRALRYLFLEHFRDSRSKLWKAWKSDQERASDTFHNSSFPASANYKRVIKRWQATNGQ